MRFFLRTPLLFAVALACFGPALSAQTPPKPPAPPRVVSPEILPDGSVTFRLPAPRAQEVRLDGQWPGGSVPFSAGENGLWSVNVKDVPPGIWEYHFVVDGLSLIDPRNPAIKPQRTPSNNILHIPANPPAPWDWQDIPHGTVHRHDYPSTRPGVARSLMVYTPPGYEMSGGKKYPLLVLQHGSGDNEQAWTVHGKAGWILDSLIQQGKARPMIVLMIHGHPLAPADASAPFDPGAAFERELLEQALPLIEARYRVRKDGAHRAIAGLSMGGGQSLTIGLRYADRFGWIGAFSAAAPLPESWDELLAKPQTLNKRLKLLWVACGRDDFLLKRNQDFMDALDKAGIKHEWHLTDGGHSWPVWRDYLVDLLPRLFAAN